MNGKSFFAVLFFLLTGLFASHVWAAEKIVAHVSDVPISEAEVQRQIDKLMPFKVNFHGKMSNDKKEKLRNDALDLLIERAYKVAYAKEEGILASASQVDESLTKIKSSYKTEDGFNQAVAKETISGLRASIYRDLVAKKAESLVVDEKIKVSDEQVENYYSEKKEMFLMPAQYRASHIMIKVDPASNKEERAELLARAKDLRVKAKNGEDFYNLAYFNSDDRTKYVGGDLGLFHAGRTEKEFDDALKTMQVGEISELVKTRWGHHIIKLTEKNEPRQLTFAEMQDKIRAQLTKAQRDAYYQQWMDGLKSKYQVERVGE